MRPDIGNGMLSSVTLSVLILGIAITAVNIFQLQKILQEQSNKTQLFPGASQILSRTNTECLNPKVWIHGKQVESGYLKHVFEVFGRLGFDTVTSEPDYDWNVLWTHEYPFTELSIKLINLKPFQKVNHFPGCGFITNKVSLATSPLKHIPKAFKLPSDKENFIEYSNLYPEKLWVQKSNSHRGIRVQTVKASFDMDNEGTFLQEFVHNPLLVDGRKFDVGIYTTLMSIDPLRVYIYAGDALLRFCEEVYYPFNESNVDSYVVGDDYLPIWKVPSLEKYYVHQHLTMKESLNAHLKEQGKNSDKIWFSINEAIAGVYREKEISLIKSASRFKTTRNFFEMVRFDFVVDEDLNVYLLEANMSPNLSSAHFVQNQLLYEQVVYNLLSLIGLAKSAHLWNFPKYSKEFQMEVSDRDIAVFIDKCSQEFCSKCPSKSICQLCQHCLSTNQKEILKSAYVEHLNKGACRRIIPQSLDQDSAQRLVQTNTASENLSLNDILGIWFAEKCLQDVSWCY